MKRKPLNPLLPRPYGRMTAEELDREVEKFDREMVSPRSKPLSAGQKAQHRRMSERKRGMSE